MFTTPIPSNTIVAVSSGVDSIAAAFLLKKKFGINRIFHFNHNCQPINVDMEDAVKRFATAHGFELILKRSDVPLVSEAECRKARLTAAFEGNTGTVLATAHHLDDFVESHILNFIRGKESFFAIPLETDFGDDNKIIHPFLLRTKAQLIYTAKRYDLMQYVVNDPTNFISKGSRRNFIRNEVIPIFERNHCGLRKICRKKIMKRLDEEAKFGVY